MSWNEILEKHFCNSLCNSCLGCNQLENEGFWGVSQCEYYRDSEEYDDAKRTQENFDQIPTPERVTAQNYSGKSVGVSGKRRY